mgnify:CR=1 FL=1
MDSKKNTTSPYPAEFRERAVQMVLDHLDSYASLTAAVRDIAAKLGCSPDSLRVWYKQTRRDGGKEAGPTSAESSSRFAAGNERSGGSFEAMNGRSPV